MNLFYLSADIDKVITNSLQLATSNIIPAYTDAYSFEGDILFFEDGGGDGFWTHSGKANPLEYVSDDSLLSNNYEYIHTMSAKRYSDRQVYRSDLNGNLELIDTQSNAEITYGNGIYCYVYVSGINELTICKSVDGILWETNILITSKITQTPKICFGNNSFIICDGSVYKSEDGAIWSTVYNDSNYWNNIVYTSYGFIISNGTHYITSILGVYWNLLSLPLISITNPFNLLWGNMVANGDTICLLFANRDTTSELIFSLDGGNSWGNQLIISYGFTRIFTLTVPKFWNHFIQTSES